MSIKIRIWLHFGYVFATYSIWSRSDSSRKPKARPMITIPTVWIRILLRIVRPRRCLFHTKREWNIYVFMLRKSRTSARFARQIFKSSAWIIMFSYFFPWSRWISVEIINKIPTWTRYNYYTLTMLNLTGCTKFLLNFTRRNFILKTIIQL